MKYSHHNNYSVVTPNQLDAKEDQSEEPLNWPKNKYYFYLFGISLIRVVKKEFKN